MKHSVHKLFECVFKCFVCTFTFFLKVKLAKKSCHKMFVKLTIGAIYNTPEPTFDNSTLMVDGSTKFSYVNVECNGHETAFDDCLQPRYFS